MHHVFSDSEEEAESEIDNENKHDDNAVSDNDRPVTKRHGPSDVIKGKRFGLVINDDDDDDALEEGTGHKPLATRLVSKVLTTQNTKKATQSTNHGTPGLSAYFKSSNIVESVAELKHDGIISTQGISQEDLGLLAYFKPSNVARSASETDNNDIPGASAFFAPTACDINAKVCQRGKFTDGHSYNQSARDVSKKKTLHLVIFNV